MKLVNEHCYKHLFKKNKIEKYYVIKFFMLINIIIDIKKVSNLAACIVYEVCPACFKILTYINF